MAWNNHKPVPVSPETSDGYKIVPQKHTYDIRCGHVEYGKPALEEDRDQQRHWRCPARFLFEPYLQHDYQRLYCPAHRSLDVPEEFRASPAEVERAVERLHARVQARALLMQQASEEKEIAERKREQIRKAHEAGILIRQPGQEG